MSDTDAMSRVDFMALAADRAADETLFQHAQRLMAERDEARKVACHLASRARLYPDLTVLRKEVLCAENENPWLKADD
jgi:hypothetical protein